MSRLNFPFKPTDQNAVAELHSMLGALGLEINKQEIKEFKVGSSTLTALAALKAAYGLGGASTMDEATIRLLNTLCGRDSTLGKQVEAQSKKIIESLKTSLDPIGTLTNPDGVLPQLPKKLESLTEQIAFVHEALVGKDELGGIARKVNEISEDADFGLKSLKTGLNTIGTKTNEITTALDSLRTEFAELPALVGTPATLSIGHQDNEVQQLQADLEAVGFSCDALESTAQLFGQQTALAVARFQASVGLPQTGIVNARTRLALKNSKAKKSKFLTLQIYVEDANGNPAQGFGIGVWSVGYGQNSDKQVPAAEAINPDPTNTASKPPYLVKLVESWKLGGLQVRLVKDGNVIARSPVMFSLSDLQVVNLRLQGTMSLASTEFDELTKQLGAHLNIKDLANAVEDDERGDITYLHQRTGCDARLIALAALAHKHTTATNIDPATLYALYRAGLPTDPARLARVHPAVVTDALGAAKAADIATINDVTPVVGNFTEFAAKKLAEDRAPGAVSAFGRLLKIKEPGGSNQTLLSPKEQEDFLKAIVEHTGDESSFWTTVQQNVLIGNDTKRKQKLGCLQLQGKLARLTGNNAALIEHVVSKVIDVNDVNLTKLVEEGYCFAEGWKTAIKAVKTSSSLAIGDLVPTFFIGDGDDNSAIEAYAQNLARKVAQAFPTHTIAKKMNTTGEPLAKLGKDAAKLLENAISKGFELGKSSLGSLLASNTNAIYDGIDPTKKNEALLGVRRLQCLHQLSPSWAALDALIDSGYRSAGDILKVTPERFHQDYGKLRLIRAADEADLKDIIAKEADLTYRQAQQIQSYSYALIGLARQSTSLPSLHVMPNVGRRVNTGAEPAPVRGSNANNSNGATLERLFGSQDLATCEPCQSVLSPAAYLVDLLRFLEEDCVFESNGEVTNAYKALDFRRPDISALELSCENTNTELPYIDLVNEILEDYVARNPDPSRTGSSAQAALPHNCAHATSQELIAEPANRRDNAYARLAGAKYYPLALPFDHPLSASRAYINRLKIPLWEVCAALRQKDELFPDIGDVTNIPLTDTPCGFAWPLAEMLGISPGEWNLLTLKIKPLAGYFPGMYGYANDEAALCMKTRLNEDGTVQTCENHMRPGVRNAKVLARRLGISYEELYRIVQTRFVNPGLEQLAFLWKIGLTIEEAISYCAAAEGSKPSDVQAKLEAAQASYSTPALAPTLQGCWTKGVFTKTLVLRDRSALQGGVVAISNFDQVWLELAQDSGSEDQTECFKRALGRMHLFVRLWRKLGWNIEDVDAALMCFMSANHDELALQYTDASGLGALGQQLERALLQLAQIKRVDELLEGALSHEQLVCLWGNIPTYGENSLYAQLFLRRSVLNIDPVFDSPCGMYLATDGVAVEDHMTAIQAALGATAEEVGLVLTRGQPETIPVTDKRPSLTLANVSLIYRHVRLARTLNLPVRDILVFKGLFSENILVGEAPTKPEEEFNAEHPFGRLVSFIEKVRAFCALGLGAAELDYLLCHEIHDPQGPYFQRWDRDSKVLLSVAAANTQNVSRMLPIAGYDTHSDTALMDFLGQLLEPAVVDEFLGTTLWSAKWLKSSNTPSDEKSKRDKIIQFLRDHLAEPKFLPDPLTPEPDPLTPANDDASKTMLTWQTPDNRLVLMNALWPLISARQEKATNENVILALASALSARITLVDKLLSDQTLMHCNGRAPIAVFRALAPTAFSAKTTYYLRFPKSGTYTFVLKPSQTIVMDRVPDEGVLGAAPPLREGDGGLAAFTVEASVLYSVMSNGKTLDFTSESFTVGSIERLGLYDQNIWETAQQCLERLRKCLLIIQKLDLTERELAVVFTTAFDPKPFKLEGLPVTASNEAKNSSTGQFAALVQLVRYTALRTEAAGGGDDLVDVLKAGTPDDKKRGFADLLRRSPIEVKKAYSALFAEAAPDVGKLVRLWTMLKLVRVLGIPLDTLLALRGLSKLDDGGFTPRQKVADSLRDALKANLPEPEWQQMVKPIADELRQRSRDALVAYVLNEESFDRTEQLFGHFLIDPGMEPIVRTSRIQLAISSVQTFVQRCLLGLEAGVPAAAIDRDRWQELHRYRVHEANKRIWLWPENWLEPEFRDDKSFLFKELESTLLKSDVSNELAEDAFATYLRGLESIARLDIVSMYSQMEGKGDQKIIHVLGRTFNQPHKYFYQRKKDGAWSMWEPVTTSIDGDHVMLAVWRNRLHVFWLTFLFKNEGPDQSPTTATTEDDSGSTTTTIKGGAAKKVAEAQLHCCEFHQRKWMPRETPGFGSPVKIEYEGEFDGKNIMAYAHVDASEVLYIEVQMQHGKKFAFKLAGRNCVPEYPNGQLPQPLPFLAKGIHATKYQGQGTLSGSYVHSISTQDDSVIWKRQSPILTPPRNEEIFFLIRPMSPANAVDALPGVASILAGYREVLRELKRQIECPAIEGREIPLPQSTGHDVGMGLATLGRSRRLPGNDASKPQSELPMLVACIDIFKQLEVLLVGLEALVWKGAIDKNLLGDLNNKWKTLKEDKRLGPCATYLDSLERTSETLHYLHFSSVSKFLQQTMALVAGLLASKGLGNLLLKEIDRLESPVIYQDSASTFYVTPSVGKSTFKDFESWAQGAFSGRQSEQQSKRETIANLARAPRPDWDWNMLSDSGLSVDYLGRAIFPSGSNISRAIRSREA